MPQIYAKDDDLKSYVPMFFLQNGNPKPYYVLTDPISNKAAAFMSCMNDLDESAAYLNILKDMLPREDTPYEAKKSLYLAAIITYIRCFNKGEGRPIQLDYNQVFKDDKMIEFHKEIRDMRNKNFAHAGGGSIDSQRVILYFDPKNLTSDKLESKINVFKLAFGHNVDRFIKLINTSKKYINLKMDNLLPRFKENVLSMGIDELFLKSKDPDSKTFEEW